MGLKWERCIMENAQVVTGTWCLPRDGGRTANSCKWRTTCIQRLLCTTVWKCISVFLAFSYFCIYYEQFKKKNTPDLRNDSHPEAAIFKTSLFFLESLGSKAKIREQTNFFFFFFFFLGQDARVTASGLWNQIFWSLLLTWCFNANPRTT